MKLPVETAKEEAQLACLLQYRQHIQTSSGEHCRFEQCWVGLASAKPETLMGTVCVMYGGGPELLLRAVWGEKNPDFFWHQGPSLRR